MTDDMAKRLRNPDNPCWYELMLEAADVIEAMQINDMSLKKLLDGKDKKIAELEGRITATTVALNHPDIDLDYTIEDALAILERRPTEPRQALREEPGEGGDERDAHE
jgi:hypothetical protein